MSDTIISSDIVLGPCRGCGRTRVNQKVFALKPQWRQQGYVRGNAFELCTGCYSRARRLGTLPEPAPRRLQAQRPAPDVRLEVTYSLVCETCGPLEAASDRATNLRRQAAHRAWHRKNRTQAAA